MAMRGARIRMPAKNPGKPGVFPAINEMVTCPLIT